MGKPFHVYLTNEQKIILCCLNCGVHIAHFFDVTCPSSNYYLIDTYVNTRVQHNSIECISCSIILGQSNFFFPDFLIWDLTL